MPLPSSQRMQNPLPEDLAFCLALAAHRKSVPCVPSRDAGGEEAGPHSEAAGRMPLHSLQLRVLIWSPVACLPTCLSLPKFFPESVEPSQTNTSFPTMKDQVVGWGRGPKEAELACTRTKGQKAKSLRLPLTEVTMNLGTRLSTCLAGMRA